MGVFEKHEDLDQGLLFPPSPRDWLPEGHSGLVLSDTVDELDLDAFLSRYRMCGKGEQAYPPRVMLKILLYAYSVGVRSSRQIAAKLETDVAFRVLGSGLFPDFRTINNFRSRHRKDFSSVFAQVVRIAQEAGLVKLGTLAIDGSKIKANASKHQAMSYERMKKEEKRPVPCRRSSELRAVEPPTRRGSIWSSRCSAGSSRCSASDSSRCAVWRRSGLSWNRHVQP